MLSILFKSPRAGARAEKLCCMRVLFEAAKAIREFVVPTYRPERHYMRGPGPACARRSIPARLGRAAA